MDRIILNERHLGAATVVGTVVKQADVRALICEKLAKGVVHFGFKKADGTVREAFGTLNPAVIPSKVEQSANAYHELFHGIITQGMDEEAMEKIVDLVEKGNAPIVAKDKVENDPNQIYYDLEARAFRSFKFDNLVVVY